MHELGVGSQFAGYEIEERLGEGGMSVVFRALEPQLGRRVALKVMAASLSEDPDFRRRFDDEARLASAIDHPNVVPIYRSGEADGHLFIAMRYVDGTDLRRILAGGPLPLDRTAALLGQVASALDAVHRAGMVHRDVKPDNILVTAGANGEPEHVYLADFGIGRSAAATHRTRTGQLLGTIAYAAPEQLRGHDVGAASDEYALACVLHQCLTGRPPYPRDDEAAVMFAHIADEPPRVTEERGDLPDALDAVVAQGLAKDPADRYPTCAALIAALRDAAPVKASTAPATTADPAATIARGKATIEAEHDEAPAVTGPAPADVESTDDEHRPGGRRRLLIAAAALLVVAVIATAVVLATRSSSQAKVAATGTTKPRQSYAFPGVAFGDGVTTDESWRLDDHGHLTGTTVVTNTGAKTVVHQTDELIPDTLARSVGAVDFATPYATVVDPDPVVRFCLTLAPHQTRMIRYSVAVTGSAPTHLAAWASARHALEHQDWYAKGTRCHGAPAKAPTKQVLPTSSSTTLPGSQALGPNQVVGGGSTTPTPAPETSAYAFSTVPPPPGAPRAVTVSDPYDRQTCNSGNPTRNLTVTVSWTAPTGGGATSYLVVGHKFQQIGGGATTDLGATPSVTSTGLSAQVTVSYKGDHQEAGTWYEYTVIAKNAGGSSTAAWSHSSVVPALVGTVCGTEGWAMLEAVGLRPQYAAEVVPTSSAQQDQILWMGTLSDGGGAGTPAGTTLTVGTWFYMTRYGFLS
jgi:serine/threonine-protein kinase